MLSEGLIHHTQNTFSSLTLLVDKKDSTWHFWVNYRVLSATTIQSWFPNPTIDDLLDELGHTSTFFFQFDLRYHQIRMHPEDIHKIVFCTFDGHYEFLVIPFGLTNASSSF